MRLAAPAAEVRVEEMVSRALMALPTLVAVAVEAMMVATAEPEVLVSSSSLTQQA